MIHLFLPGLTNLAVTDDWPHWRGKTRDGHTSEASGYTDGNWKLAELWTAKLGDGSSSPVIVDDLLYSFFWRDGKEILECRSANTGEVVWEQSYSARRYGRLATGDQGLFSGPCSTPEFDMATKFIYTLGSDGHLTCWDTANKGKRVWQGSLYDRYEIPRRPKVGRSGLRDYGYTSSPMLMGEWLVVEVGAKSGNLIAFGKSDGKEVWKSEANSSAGHNGGPVGIRVGDIPCIAVHNHDGLLVVRADKENAGKTVATVDWITSFANNIATVGVTEDRIILTSAYNQNRTACFQITPSGAKKIWENKHPSKICSPIIHNGKVYFSWRSIKCMDLATGKLDWEGESTGDAGSMILTSDERLIVWSKNGDLTLVESAKRSPNKLTVLGRKKVFSRTDAWPHIVLANGKLFCKDRLGNFKCFQLPD